uniref:Uncharacterized protein n=1 Tax=Anguilla anguilla TaxID=7936 RepID=A0A0E9TFT7_ANGAN
MTRVGFRNPVSFLAPHVGVSVSATGHDAVTLGRPVDACVGSKGKSQPSSSRTSPSLSWKLVSKCLGSLRE